MKKKIRGADRSEREAVSEITLTHERRKKKGKANPIVDGFHLANERKREREIRTNEKAIVGFRSLLRLQKKN